MYLQILSPQYLTGFSAVLSVMASAGCFGWTAPVMASLADPQSDLYMTSSQIALVILLPELGDFFISLCSGYISDKWGRKYLILLSGPLYATGWIIIIFTKSYIMICLARIIQGFSVGITFSIIPTYLGEISSNSRRGSVTSLFCSAWFFGYLFEYCVGPLTSYTVFTLITALVPVLFTVLFFFQPESPYYLLMKGRDAEAAETLAWLRKGSSENEIEQEFEDMKQSVKESMRNKATLRDVIATPEDRRALLIVLIITSVRVLNGGFVIMSYSTQLFSENGPSFLSPDILTIIMGLSLFLGGFINTSLIDNFGRRPLLFISSLGCFVCMLILTIYFFVQSKFPAQVSSYSWIVPIGIILFSSLIVVGIYPVSVTYTSELFTTKTRGRAASIVSINLTIVSSFGVKLYQVVVDNYGLYAIFLFFTIISLIGVVSFYVLAPETKGKSFTEIREELYRASNKNKLKASDFSVT